MSPISKPDLLAAIVAATRHDVEYREQKRSYKEIESLAVKVLPRVETFRAALTKEQGFNVIAECKQRSPIRGVLRAHYQPDLIAIDYAKAGAVAISVLTEPAFFSGSLNDLALVRDTVELPLLCKDFIVSSYQIVEALESGADAVLLIVSALDDETLGLLIQTAGNYGMSALVEVHDGVELSRAVDAGAEIIGVNNRNLRTLDVNLEASQLLISKIPKSIITVSESGIKTHQDLVCLHEAGYDAFLVGESLMTKPSPGKALQDLLSNKTIVGLKSDVSGLVQTGDNNNGEG